MLNEKERTIIEKWNEFGKRPRGDAVRFRQDLERFCSEQGWDKNLPKIGALHRDIELRPGLRADIAVPEGQGPHPVAILLHGGGWIAGSLNTHRKLAMHFAEHGYVTVHPDYRLAPENPFPAGFDDCVFTAKWTDENASHWNGDPSRMLIAGDSAGGNLAAAVLLALSDQTAAPRFRAAAFIYGVFDFPSMIERSPARAAVEGMARTYLGSHYPDALKDPRVSPLRAIKAGSLPASFVISGTADLLLPESRSIAAALKEAGIECESCEIADMPHAFMHMEELSGCREGQRMMFDFLRRHV